MTQEEIIEKAKELLELHLIGLRGDIDQHSYKYDFFRLFKEAYVSGYFHAPASPLLTGDEFREILITRWFTDDEQDNHKKTLLMYQLFSKWDEWRYAWEHHDL
jgi:hypothetical protein